MMRNIRALHKINTLYWIPGCTLHRRGAFSCYHFVVALQVDVVDWKILAYTTRVDEGAEWEFKPALIDLKHPNRFWLWQSDRRNMATQTAWVLRLKGGARLDYDTLGPWRIVQKLPSARLASFTDSLMKGFYDLSAQHLAYLHQTIRLTDNLLVKRIDAAIQYANGVASRSKPPHS